MTGIPQWSENHPRKEAGVTRTRLLVGIGVVALLVVLGALAHQLLFGRTRMVTFAPYAGQVLNADTRTPIPGVQIKITWTSSSQTISFGPDGTPLRRSYWEGVTDQDGRFRMPGRELEVGTTWMTMDASFKAGGYRPKLLVDTRFSDAGGPHGAELDLEGVPALEGEDNVVLLKRK